MHACMYVCMYVYMWLQLRFDFDSVPIRLQFDRATTVRRQTLRLRVGWCIAA